MIEARLLSKSHDSDVTHINKQRRGNLVWTQVFLSFTSEDECKEFCDRVGNDPVKFVQELYEGVKK